MREEIELNADIERARQAKALINHPLFIAALNELEEAENEKFKSLKFDDVIQMQECNVTLKVIDDFKLNLVRLISNGKAATEAIEIINRHNEEMKR